MTLVIRFLEEHIGEEAFTLESRILNAARLSNCGTFCHERLDGIWTRRVCCRRRLLDSILLAAEVFLL